MKSMKLSSFLESMIASNNKDDFQDDVSVLGNDSIGGLLGMDNETRNYNKSNDVMDFAFDDVNDITYGRRIARYLSKYNWYNPQKSVNEENLTESSISEPLLISMNALQQQQEAALLPNLDKAWAFFEHFTLPRYIYRPQDENAKTFDRAEPGANDQPTKLYSPLSTPLDQMGDFGIGIGLYFSCLKYLVILTFVAGVLSLPTIVYYASDEYSGVQKHSKTNIMDHQQGIPISLKGSAICTHTTWVTCPTCDESDFKGAELRLRTNDETGVTEALKNECNAPSFAIGLTQWFVIVGVCLGFFYINHKQEEMQVIFDEDEQTAQDYSIHIHNPPGDSIDPEEYNTFFSQFGHVTCCCVCVNNDILVQSLVERRERYQQIKRKLPPNTSLEDDVLAKIAAEDETKNKFFRRLINEFLLYPLGIYDFAGLHQRIAVLNEKIRGLVQLSYPVTNVFITFETEKAQRDCLTALSVGKYYSRTNTIPKGTKNQYLLRNSYVLDVEEAEEPSSMRWQSLNMTFIGRLKVVGFTLVVTFGAIGLLAFMVKLLHDKSAVYSALAISFFNAIFPLFSWIMTNMEPHKSEGDKQTSLFLKIVLFRWVNTAIVIDVITPFSQKLAQTDVESEDAALLAAVYAIFFSDLFISTTLMLVDPFGHLDRHYFGPRAVDQDSMNLCFLGTDWKLAERYTSVSKTLFLCFYYATIFPNGYFLCSLSILVVYYVDSFAIMRTWKRVPQLGTSIAVFNDKYVIPTTILALSVLSSYWWSAFPMDNLCVDDTPYKITYHPSLSPAPTISMYPVANTYSSSLSVKPTTTNLFPQSPAPHRLLLQLNSNITPPSLSNTLGHQQFIASNDIFNGMAAPSVSSISNKNDEMSSFEFKTMRENPMLPISNDIIANKDFKAFHPTISPTSFSDSGNGETYYKYCNQNLLNMNVFPAQADSTWMTDDQQTITNLFGWTSIAVLAIICLWFVWLMIVHVSEFFTSSYEACGDDMGINFSEVESRSTYIPQVFSTEFPYPLIACDCSGIDDELFDWESDKSYEYYNITLDVKNILNKNNSIEMGKSVFSIVKYWPVIDIQTSDDKQQDQNEIVEGLAEQLKLLKAHHRA